MPKVSFTLAFESASFFINFQITFKVLLSDAGVFAKQDTCYKTNRSCYKVEQVLQSGTIVTKWAVLTLFISES